MVEAKPNTLLLRQLDYPTAFYFGKLYQVKLNQTILINFDTLEL